MSSLQTQYQNYLKENPESSFTFEEWSDWKFSNPEIPPPHNGLRPFDEYDYSLKVIDDLSDWDVTLMDGLENEPPYVSDDFQIGPDGAYEHTEEHIEKQYKRKDMSKVTIEFDRVEEAEELRVALDGYKYKSVIWELDQKLRSVCKYGSSLEGNKEATVEEINTCENLREIIRELLREYNLPIE